MAEKSLAQKMKLKPGHQAAVIGASEAYLQELKHDSAIAQKLNGQFDWIQIFVQNKKDLDSLAPKAAKALKADSILWISFPKGTSKIQTDLMRDQGWDVVRELDLKWITLISINETWSAFSLRPYKTGEAKQSFR